MCGAVIVLEYHESGLELFEGLHGGRVHIVSDAVRQRALHRKAGLHLLENRNPDSLSTLTGSCEGPAVSRNIKFVCRPISIRVLRVTDVP